MLEKLDAIPKANLKRWHGHRVCAVDASQLRLPREPALQEKFGCQSAIPVKPSKLLR
jgi:hypothetical protein